VSPEFVAADRYFVDQLIRPVANLYRISANGAPVAFVRQKRFALKEDIRFFADDAERDELFRLKARQVLDVGGRYDVATPDGQIVGTLEKVFGRSLLRSTWRILDPTGAVLAVAEERSMPLAILRRVIDFVPYGDLVPILFHFTIRTEDGRALGELTRRFGFRDRYDLDLTGDADREIDRRVAIALAIALDALQSR